MALPAQEAAYRRRQPSPPELTQGTLAPQPVAAGTYYIYITSQSNAAILASTTFTVRGMALSSTSGHVGDSLTVSGSYFPPGQFAITYDGVTVTTVTVPSSGAFSTTITVPSGVAGTHQIAAKAGTSVISQASFTVLPKLVLSPASAPPGAQVTATGSGFASGKSVTLTWDGDVLATLPSSFTTSSNGGFTVTFDVPVAQGGDHEVEATAGTLSAVATFDLFLGLSVTPGDGPESPVGAGQTIVLSGWGFTPDDEVEIKLSDITLEPASTDSSGAFEAHLTVPSLPRGGRHTIRVTDGVVTGEIEVFVELTPPPAVQGIVPSDGERAGSRPRFDWEDTSDPSGVSYTLQIATDSAFTDIVLEKTGLRYSEYILGDEEELEPLEEGGLYYWRVRAVDGAGNAGPWSDATTFSVRSSFWEGLPGWTTYVWIGLGVIAAGFIGFFIGRRSIYWGAM